MYDRLAVVGVTTCFQGAGRLVDEIGKHNYDAVIQSLKNGNPFRLIAIVTQKKAFAELSDVPQCLSKDLPLELSFLPMWMRAEL